MAGWRSGGAIFFTISGFLITWLMIVEKETTGHVNLFHFYARRALRILPVYFAFLGVLAILQLVTPMRQVAATWIGNLTFTTNFCPIGWPSGHLWSLAVEEQFYLLWPGLFLLCGTGARTRRLIILFCAVIIVAPVCRVITYKQLCPASLSWAFTHFSFFNYFDSLAVGCAGAVVAARKREFIQTRLVAMGSWVTVVGFLLILVPYLAEALHLPGRIYVFFRNSMQGFGFGLLLLDSVFLPWKPVYRWLNWSWVRFIGVLSYSIYIWQQLFWIPPEEFGMKPAWWMSFPGWILSALVTGTISYYGFERPLLKMRARFRDVGFRGRTP